MPMTKDFLEVTTAIGCPVACLKYCPQEVLTKRYTGPKLLSLDNFETIISTVPRNVAIRIGGFCEPFTNKETAKMILAAHEAGHKLQLLTTLVGATVQDIKSLDHVPFEHILLHLPDPYNNARIPVTAEYLDKLMVMLTTHDCYFIAMNATFPTNHHEDAVRGKPVKKNRYPVTCDQLHHRQVEVMPNGDVYPCCMDWGLDSKLGNLLVQSWREIPRAKPSSICRVCTIAMFPPIYHLHKFGVKFFHGDT